MKKNEPSLVTQVDTLNQLLDTINQRFDKDYQQFQQFQESVQQLVQTVSSELGDRALLVQVSEMYIESKNYRDENNKLKEQIMDLRINQRILEEQLENQLQENRELNKLLEIANNENWMFKKKLKDFQMAVKILEEND